MSTLKRTLSAVFAAAILVGPAPLWAVDTAGIENEVLSARSAGQGYVSVAAQNNDPMVTYSNPAGLTKLKGTQATLGAALEHIAGTYVDDSGNQTKKRVGNDVIPNLGVSQQVALANGHSLGLGLSVESPYGLETKWPSNSPLAYVTTNSSIFLAIVSPAVAYQLSPMASVGVGADYVNVFEADLERHIADPFGGPDGNSKLSGTGANWGYHAGLLLEPNEKNSIGVVYHSRVKLRILGTATLSGLSNLAPLFGGSEFTTSAYTDLYLPQNIQLGYAYKPTDRWTFEADAGWYDWSPNHDLNVRFAETDPTRLTVLNVGNPTPLNWRNAWGFDTGANYKYSERLQLRGGFFYEPWIEPESAFSPNLIDLSRYGLAAGFGYGLTENLTVDLAYSALFFHNRHISNTVGFDTSQVPGVTVNGTYKNFVHIFNIGFTYRWGQR